MAAEPPVIIDDPMPVDPGLRKVWERDRVQRAINEHRARSAADADDEDIPSGTTSHPLGRTVWYRHPDGRTAPALITASYPDTTLTGPTYVHLAVFIPTPELTDDTRPPTPYVGHQVFDVPYWERLADDPEPFAFDHQPTETWMWPL